MILNWGACTKCGTGLISTPCPDKSGMCGVAHAGCPKCRAVPCKVCQAPVQPEVEHGVCHECKGAALVWAARQARMAGYVTQQPAQPPSEAFQQP